MKKLFLISAMFLPLLTLQGCSFFELPFSYYNEAGNLLYAKGEYGRALTEYEKALAITGSDKALALNHQGLARYRQGKYQAAETLYTSAVEFCDPQKPYCSQVYYNAGNNLYRLGEAAKDTAETKEYWTKAVSSYEEAVKLDPTDREAAENLEFVRKKLQDLEQKMENQQGKDGQDNEQDQQQQEQGQKQDQESGQQQNQQQDKTGEQQDSESGRQGEQQPALDQQTKEAIEQYSKELEQTEKDAQQFFQRDGQRQEGSDDPLQNMMQDPMFQQFFGDSPFMNDPFLNPDLQKNLNNNSDEKDW